MCPPLTHISLKYWKVEHLYRYDINRATKAIQSNTNAEEIVQIENLTTNYKSLVIDLKKNPTQQNIIKMLNLYEEQLYVLNKLKSKYENTPSKLPNM